MNKLSGYIVLFIAIVSVNFAQPEKNLDLFFNLVDSSYNEIKNDIPQSVKVDFEGDTEFGILKNRFIYNFSKDSKEDNSGSENQLKLIIQNAEVKYIYSDAGNIVSGYDVNRRISLKCSYIIYENGKMNISGEFEKSIVDTVEYDHIPGIETSGLNFTKGSLPEESFMSGLVEPLIAVAAVVTTIYLLFTVRSN
jgi:hypothetical protein